VLDAGLTQFKLPPPTSSTAPASAPFRASADIVRVRAHFWVGFRNRWRSPAQTSEAIFEKPTTLVLRHVSAPPTGVASAS
jgi:hypothetical protein